jgi:hydrogenase expression/formation protein HypE
VAILSVREGIAFEGDIESDSACLWPAVEALLASGVEVHCLRDCTRGGVATALNEVASKAGVAMSIAESAVKVRGPVAGACELLGLDPLYVANEGRFLSFVPAAQAEEALRALRGVAVSAEATVIGKVVEGRAGEVTLESAIGGRRVLDLLSGEQLPRIC